MRPLMPIGIQDISDADVQNLLSALDTGDPKNKAIVNALLATIAGMATTIERLDRARYLDEAALNSVESTFAAACPIDKLRAAFDAPDKGVDIKSAVQKISDLSDRVRQQTDAAQTFATIAKTALTIARVFI